MRELNGKYFRALCVQNFSEPVQDLDAHEQARAARYKIPADRQQSEIALSLAHRLGVASVRHDEKGRPFDPQKNKDLSLSHKDGIVVAACVDFGNRVGVDVENSVAIRDPEKFAKRTLAPGEKLRLPEFMKRWNASEREVISALWSLKESFYKATGFDPGPANTEFADTEVRAGGKFYAIKESLIEIEDGRVLTLLVF